MTSVLCPLDLPLIMRWVVFIFGGMLFSQLAWAQQERVSNSIRAIVGGQKIITQWDVERKAGGRTEVLAPALLALAQKKLETEALLVISIKGQKGYVEPPGRAELLLKRELKNRYGNNRKKMIDTLRKRGKTVHQREAELWDEVLLGSAMRSVRQSVQVSPAAIKKYYSENPNMNDKGLTVDLYAIRIPLDEKGINLGKVREMTNGINSIVDFKKLAEELNVAGNVHKGIVHKNDPGRLSKEVAGEAFTLEEKEAGFTLDKEAYHLLYVEKRWGKYEIPLSQVHKLIEVRLAQEVFEQEMSQKEKRMRRDIHVYYPPSNSLLLNK